MERSIRLCLPRKHSQNIKMGQSVRYRCDMRDSPKQFMQEDCNFKRLKEDKSPSHAIKHKRPTDAAQSLEFMHCCGANSIALIDFVDVCLNFPSVNLSEE